MTEERSWGTVFLGSLALGLLACSLLLPWFSFDHNSARDTPPGGPQAADETGIVQHSLDLYATHIDSDISASNAALARTLNIVLPIIIVAASLAIAAVTIGDTRLLAGHLSRRTELVLCASALVAAIALAAAGWWLVPQTMAEAGIRSAYTARLTDEGYIQSTLEWGWYSALLSIPALIGAGLFKVAAGGQGPDAVEYHIQQAKARSKRKGGHELTMQAGTVLLISCLIALPHPVSAQSSAFYQQDGLEYYRATGIVGSGHLSIGQDFDGTHQEAFSGCVVAKLRPDTNQGRIQVHAAVGNVPFEVEFDSFLGPETHMDGGIATTVAVDGSSWDGKARHPAVMAGAAAWGTGTVYAGGAGMVDPATGNPAWRATYFTTPQGFRDNQTGAIFDTKGSAYELGERAKVGNNDWESHLILESIPGPTAEPTVTTLRDPPNGIAYLPPAPEYRAKFSVENVAFGGTANIQVEVQTIDPVGTTNLTFVVRDVSGRTLGSLNAAPGLQQPVQRSTAFNITQFGRMEIDVGGSVSLASYTVTITQIPPPAPTVLDLWWDSNAFGYEAVAAEDDCIYDVQGGAQGLAPIPPLARPPPFPLATVLLTISGLITAGVVSIALIATSRAQAPQIADTWRRR